MKVGLIGAGNMAAARGLAALERGGVRAAFASAMDDVLGPA